MKETISRAKWHHTPVLIFEGVVLVTSSIGNIKGSLKEGLDSGARRIIVQVENTTLKRRQLESMALSNSDLVFTSSRGKFTSLINRFLRVAHDLKPSSAPLFTAICFGKEAAISAVASRKDGMGLILEQSHSTSGFGVGSYEAPGRLDLRLLLRLLTMDLFTSALSRFFFVGISGAVVNTLVLAMQVQLIGLKPFLAVPLAVEASVVWNFLLNDKYTFRSGKGRRLNRLLKYNSSSAFSFLMQLSSVYTLTELLKIHYLIATIVGIGLGFIVNYLLSLKIWRGPKH